MAPRWDIIVLTAMDHSQKLAFELQLKNSKIFSDNNDEKSPPIYRVYSDDESGLDAKIGSGGATLFALKNLHTEFGQLLYEKRVLLIHAGGYSQRQPNGSALGKIFTLVPATLSGYDDIPMTLFQLKVQIYSKFLPFLPAGVFLASADTLEYFPDENLHNCDAQMFAQSGFTVIAHPSPLSVAVQHGVYVLCPEHVKRMRDKPVFACPVVKVLQKPSTEEIRAACAANDFATAEDSVNLSSSCANEFAYTDSVYFFASDVARAFVDFVAARHPDDLKFRAEVCAYGDFLRPLGAQNSPDYAISDLQRSLFALLRKFSVKAAVFNQSRFYHLGTFDELLHAYCSENGHFVQDFSLSRFYFSEILTKNDLSDENHQILVKNCQFLDKNQNLRKNFENLRGSLICSLITEDSQIPPFSLVEKCHFSHGIVLKRQSILSNCRSKRRHVIDLPVFITTIPIIIADTDTEKRSYVTIVFDLRANLKKIYGNSSQIPFFDKFLSDFLQVSGGKSDDSAIFADKPVCLWYARIFPAYPTMEESFDCSVDSLESFSHGSRDLFLMKSRDVSAESRDYVEKRFYSMRDVLLLKDVRDMLNFYNDLCSEISKSK